MGNTGPGERPAADRGSRETDGAAPWAPASSLAPPRPFQPGETFLTAAPGEIERLIEETGARYVTDLGALTAELGRYYVAQLAARDDQIAALTGRADTAEQAQAALQEELHDTRSARDHLAALLDESQQEEERLAAQLADLRREFGQQIGEFRRLSETLSQHVAEVEATAIAAPNGRT